MSRTSPFARTVALGFVVMIALAPALGAMRADCAEGEGVLHEGVCIDRDELLFLANDDQDRADIAAAIAPYGGEFATTVDRLRMFNVRFPVSNAADLDRIKAELTQAGFYVVHNVFMELFASAGEPRPADGSAIPESFDDGGRRGLT